MNLCIKHTLTNIKLHTKWIKQFDPISNLLIKSREKKYQKRSPNQPNKTNTNQEKQHLKDFITPLKRLSLRFTVWTHSKGCPQIIHPFLPATKDSWRSWWP